MPPGRDQLEARARRGRARTSRDRPCPRPRATPAAAVGGSPGAGASSDATTCGRSTCSTALIRSWRLVSSSSGSTGTARWARIGPPSTVSSTRWTVVPDTRTPAASASRTGCAPGNAGRSAACRLTMRPRNAASTRGPTNAHVPRKHDEIGRDRDERGRKRLVGARDRGRPPRRARARSRSPPPSPTRARDSRDPRTRATTSAPRAPRREAATSAWRLVPAPETPTAIRFVTGPFRRTAGRRARRSGAPRRSARHVHPAPRARDQCRRVAGATTIGHAHAAVERGAKLVVLEAAETAEQAHHRRHRPRGRIDPDAEMLGEDARHVPGQPTAGDVGDGVDVGAGLDQPLSAGQHRRRVDPRRRQQHVAQRGERRLRLDAQALVARLVAESPLEHGLERCAQVEVPIGDDRADERVAVGVQAGRGESDHDVAGSDGRAVEEPVAFDDADAEARRGRTPRAASGPGARPSRHPPARRPRARSRGRSRRRARRRLPARSGRPRCSRGRRAGLRRGRRRRRRTSRRGPGRSCRSD